MNKQLKKGKAVASATARPQYNMAADILTVAHEKYRTGKVKDALELFAIAMESEGAEELMQTLDAVNAETEIGIKAEAAFEDMSDEEVVGDEEIADEAASEDEDLEDTEESLEDDAGEGEEIPEEDYSEDEEGLGDEFSEEEFTDESAEDEGEVEDEEAELSDSDGEEVIEEDGEEELPPPAPVASASKLDALIRKVTRNLKAKAAEEDEDDAEENKMTVKMRNAAIERQRAKKANSELDKQQRALANKLSLSGNEKHRRMASSCIKQ